MNRFYKGDIIIDIGNNKLNQNYLFIDLIIENQIFYKFYRDFVFSHQITSFSESYDNIKDTHIIYSNIFRNVDG